MAIRTKTHPLRSPCPPLTVAGTGERYARDYRWTWPLLAFGTFLALLGHPRWGAVFIIPGTLGVLYAGILTLLLPRVIASELLPYAEWARACRSAADAWVANGAAGVPAPSHDGDANPADVESRT